MNGQLLSDGMHALVVVIVVICTTVLALLKLIPTTAIAGIYGAALAYAAARAGARIGQG